MLSIEKDVTSVSFYGLCFLLYQESSHRCASEIISGLVRGSKHWEYSQVATFLLYFVKLTELLVT